MALHIPSYMFPPILLLCVSVIVAIYQWQVRGRQGVAYKALALLILLGGDVWTGASILEALLADLELKIILVKIAYIGVAAAPTLWLVFALLYSNRDKTLSIRMSLLLGIMPCAAALLALTNESHNLMWASLALNENNPTYPLDAAYGPAFYVHLVYSFVAISIAIVIFVRQLTMSAKSYHLQIYALVAGTMIPPLTNVLELAFHPVAFLDLTPLTLCLVTAILPLIIPHWQTKAVKPLAYETVVDGIAESVIVLNEHSEIVHLNRSAREIITKSDGNIIGRKLTDMLPELSVLGDVRSKSVRFEKLILGNRMYDVSLSPLIDWRNDLFGHVIVFHDITALTQAEAEIRRYSSHLEGMVQERSKRLEESERQFQVLFNHIPDPVIILDSKGSFLEVSNSACALTGFDRAELVERSFLRTGIATAKGKTALLRNLAKRMKGERIDPYEVEVLSKAGEVIPCEVNATRTGYNGKPADLVVLRDLRERKRMEETRERLISAVTHELRTPLVSIKGYLDYMLSGNATPLSSQFRPMLEIVKRNSDRLLNLTNDLLDIRRVEAGRLELNAEPLDLRDMVRHSVEEIQPMIEKRQQHLTVELPERPLTARVDKVRVGQVLTNLLNNASKFTSEKGKVTVRVQEKEDKLQIEVSDTGIGIRKDDLERIFEPFAKIRKGTQIEGTGLGLSVSRRLVEAHGGRIWASSEGEGKGTAITFTLPKA